MSPAKRGLSITSLHQAFKDFQPRERHQGSHGRAQRRDLDASGPAARPAPKVEQRELFERDGCTEEEA